MDIKGLYSDFVMLLVSVLDARSMSFWSTRNIGPSFCQCMYGDCYQSRPWLTCCADGFAADSSLLNIMALFFRQTQHSAVR